MSAFSFEQTLIIISREILPIIRGFTEKGIIMEKNNLREVLIMVAWVLLVLALMVMNHKIIDPAYPEHIIGLSGLMEVRHYLVTYIFSTLGCGISATIIFFALWAVFGRKSDGSGKSKGERIAMVIFAVLLGYVTFLCDKQNDLDILGQKRHDSKNGILKSISLLVDVNHDIRKEETRELYYTDLAVKKADYSYYRGKGYQHVQEVVVVNGDDIISQIGRNDGATMDVLLMAGGRSHKVEIYEKSGFIKSISGIDDFSEFDFSDNDADLLKKYIK